MMPNETGDDRRYYDAKFNAIFDKLDDINESISSWQMQCVRQHAHDAEVLALIQGNGKPALAVRLDRLEEAIPRKEKSIGFWMSLVAIVAAISTAIAEFLHK